MSFPVYAPPPPPRPARRRLLRVALVAVPTLAVVAGASSVVTLAIAGDHPVTTGSGQPASASAPAQHSTVGTLTAQDGSAWVVRTAKGASVTVQVGASTSFGTKAHPAASSAFHAGAKVKVVGTPSGTTVEAKRVLLVGGATTGDRPS